MLRAVGEQNNNKAMEFCWMFFDDAGNVIKISQRKNIFILIGIFYIQFHAVFYIQNIERPHSQHRKNIMGRNITNLATPLWFLPLKKCFFNAQWRALRVRGGQRTQTITSSRRGWKLFVWRAIPVEDSVISFV